MNGNATSDEIWNFAPKTELGTLLYTIGDIPIERQYLPISRNEYINALKITITDQLDRLIDLNIENTENVLYLKMSFNETIKQYLSIINIDH